MKRFPSDLRISLIYVILGALWILFSDKAMRRLINDTQLLNDFEIYKGWFFVAITGILLYMLIHSELKRRNKILEELKIAKQKAEESDKLKSAFLANISHYLRTPMNSILGFVDLLQNRNIDEKKKERFLSVINEQSSYLLQFISNIIEISKLQSGQSSLSITEFSLNDLLRKLHIRYQTEIEYLKKNNEIILRGLYNKQDILFKSDPEKIEYILTNLLSNAVKFTRKGEITFGYNCNHTMVEFFVSDTGTGIPSDKQDHIINSFMLSNPDLNEENVGIGLGLAITNGLVKILNGELWLYRSDENGTEFRFTLPMNHLSEKAEIENV